MHRGCPSHCAAVVETDDGYEAAYLCLDPVGHGHIDRDTARTATSSPATNAPASGMTDEQKDERRKVIANNKAWETATPVRREFVTDSWPGAASLRGLCGT